MAKNDIISEINFIATAPKSTPQGFQEDIHPYLLLNYGKYNSAAIDPLLIKYKIMH